MSKLDQLKKINEKKKELAAQQKAIREELDATKDQRKESRKVQAEARKDVREQKAELRDLSAKIYEVFSSNDPEVIGKLADAIMESASELSGTIRKFADAAKDPEVESSDEEL
jgi:uncharacterized protein (DUF3084 family)